MEKRREDKTNTVQIKRTNVRRNATVQYLSYLLNVSPYVSSFVQYLSYFLSVSPYVRSFLQYLSYLLNASPYVSSFAQYLSYLLNVSPYVSSFVQYLSYFLSVSLYVSSFVQYLSSVFVLSSQRFSVRYSDSLLIYHKASCYYFAVALLQRSSSSQCRLCSTHAVIFCHCCSAMKTAFVQSFRCAHCRHW